MSTGRAPRLLIRLARRHGLVSSPLRRTTDRIEAAMTLVLVVLAVLVVPAAILIARGTYHRERRPPWHAGSYPTASSAARPYG
jgi:hypothetical protein